MHHQMIPIDVSFRCLILKRDPISFLSIIIGYFHSLILIISLSKLTHHYGYDMANRKEPNEDIMLKNDAGQPIIAFVAKMKMVTIFG